MVLYINACVRYDSRTAELASYLIDKIRKPFTEIRLHEIDFPVVDEAFINRRNEMVWNKDFDDPLCFWAKQFAEADTIIIAAPFWDLSFPAALKQYFEQINVLGVTFVYNEEGFPQ